MHDLDIATIRKAIAISRDSGFRRIKLKVGEGSFQATLSEDALGWGEAWESDAPELGEPIPMTKPVEAGVVGYLRLSGDKLSEGATVKSGDVIAEILALGIANEVTAPATGKVSQVYCKDGDAVEYGQVLAEIDES